jgi:hypothetical protein
MIKLLYIALLIVGFLSCQSKKQEVVDRFKSLPDNEGGQIIRMAIERAGGWENWISKNSLSYIKKITHLDSTGAVESTEKQFHIYELKNGFKGRIEWAVGNDNFQIINDGAHAKKYKNGNELADTKSKDDAWDTSFGSHYVISMPFKLTDEGVSLTYEGIDTLILDRPVHSVKVEYAKGAGSTGGMHLWWYLFDVDTYDLVGNYLDHGKGYTINIYEGFQEVDGLRIHKKRNRYISNEKKELVMLRTIYEYEEMKFDVAVNESVFKLR